jgi:hypothetical protein
VGTAEIDHVPAGGNAYSVCLIVRDVCDLHDILALHNPVQGKSSAGTGRLVQNNRQFWCHSPYRDVLENLTVGN